eukprot:SAG22_NODE_58_length_23645_cov_16.637943_7_plen_145_part_00
MPLTGVPTCRLSRLHNAGVKLRERTAELDKAQGRCHELEREVGKRDRRIEILGNLNRLNKQDSMLTAHNRALSFQSKMKSFKNEMLTSADGVDLQDLGKRATAGGVLLWRGAAGCCSLLCPLAVGCASVSRLSLVAGTCEPDLI